MPTDTEIYVVSGGSVANRVHCEMSGARANRAARFSLIEEKSRVIKCENKTKEN